MRKLAMYGVVAAAAVWTVYWLVAGWSYLQEHSIVVQQGFGGDGVQMWEVFNIKMVAAHHAIRWAAGLIPAVLLFRALRPGTGSAGGVGHEVREVMQQQQAA